MRAGHRIILLLAATAALSSAATASATAASSSGLASRATHGAMMEQLQIDDAPSIPPALRSQIDAIPVASLRAEVTKALTRQTDATRRTQASIDYASYMPAGASERAKSLPSACGQASITWMNGRSIWNQVFTSCDGRSWSDLDYHMRLVRQNPYNPFDNKIIKDSYPDMPGGSSAHYDQVIACRNSTQTVWEGYATGTLVIGGTTYSATTLDAAGNVMCGW